MGILDKAKVASSIGGGNDFPAKNFVQEFQKSNTIQLDNISDHRASDLCSCYSKH
jgi:hypothetical protein